VCTLFKKSVSFNKLQISLWLWLDLFLKTWLWLDFRNCEPNTALNPDAAVTVAILSDWHLTGGCSIFQRFDSPKVR